MLYFTKFEKAVSVQKDNNKNCCCSNNYQPIFTFFLLKQWNNWFYKLFLRSTGRRRLGIPHGSGAAAFDLFLTSHFSFLLSLGQQLGVLCRRLLTLQAPRLLQRQTVSLAL